MLKNLLRNIQSIEFKKREEDKISWTTIRGPFIFTNKMTRRKRRRPSTKMARVRVGTLQQITEEAKRIGIPKTQFIDNLFNRYKRELR